MTKKEFKDRCLFQTYTGRRIKINAIFYDWSQGEIDNKYFIGYKYMVRGDSYWMTKKELFDEFYNFIIKGTNLNSDIDYKYAETDLKRFKLPISM